MPLNCPLGFGSGVSCRQDCSAWHRHFAFCTERYESWQEAEQVTIPVPPSPPKRDELLGELRHLERKLNEHLDRKGKRDASAF